MDPLEWLREDIKQVKDDVKDLKGMVDELRKFKWQIMGGTVVVSLFLTIVFQIILAVIQSNRI